MQAVYAYVYNTIVRKYRVTQVPDDWKIASGINAHIMRRTVTSIQMDPFVRTCQMGPFVCIVNSSIYKLKDFLHGPLLHMCNIGKCKRKTVLFVV